MLRYSPPGVGFLDKRYLKLDASNDPVTGALAINAVTTITGPADGGLTNYDLKVGDTDASPTYGMVQIGDSVIGRTSYKVANIDLDGSILYRNMGGPVTGKIEHIFTEATGNTCRFAIPKSGVGNATYNARSMLIAGPAPTNTDFVTVGYWQTNNNIFDNLACDTAGDGADLGVQNDLEVEGDIFVDSMKESTTNAGITFNSGSGVDERGILFSDGGTGVSNLFIGDNAGRVASSGVANVGLGTLSLGSITDGVSNTAVGYKAGAGLESGDRNLFIGRETGVSVVDANNNMYMGYFSGKQITGSANMGIGAFSLGGLGDGGTASFNTAIGDSALRSLTNGINNVVIGGSSGLLVTMGDSNIFIGFNSGAKQTTNDNLLIIDNQTRADVATELTNSIIYGVMASTPGSQSLRLNADVLISEDLDMDEGKVSNMAQIAMKSAVEATISSGAITITEGHIKVDTESDTANDDLDTITSTQSGEILFLLPEDDARTVRIRHGEGNIFLKHQVESKSFNFASPSGSSGTFYSGGYYNWASADANLTQASLSVTHSAANSPSACHIAIVAGGAGVVDTGVVKITISGTTIDDNGVRAASQTVDLVADITALSTNQYVETTEKWIGQVTIALATASGSPVNFNVDINYGCSKYEDFGNQAFTITVLECVGRAGANDTGFNLRLFHHSATGWTYAAAGFVPGGTVLANMNTDYSTEQDLANGESFAYKRVNLNTDVAGDSGEGLILEVTTSANKAVETMDIHFGVHTAPNFAYMATTKQHLIFMKHGSNWLEL